jgi:hypothetical protein
MLAGSECSELDAMVATAVPGVAAVGGPEPEACWLSATRGARHVGVTAPHCAASSVGNEIRQPLRRSICEQPDVTLRQTAVRLRSARLMVSRPVRQRGDVARARRPFSTTSSSTSPACRWYGLQTVHLVNGPRGWELAGVDAKQRSFARRLLPKARVGPSPDRAIDWADLQTFVPRFTDPALPAEPDPPPARFRLVGGLIVRVLCCA